MADPSEEQNNSVNRTSGHQARQTRQGVNNNIGKNPPGSGSGIRKTDITSQKTKQEKNSEDQKEVK